MSTHKVTSCLICVYGFERFRNSDEIIVSAPLSRGITKDTLLQRLEEHNFSQADDCDYFGTTTSYINDNWEKISARIADLDRVDLECDENADGCHLFLYLQIVD